MEMLANTNANTVATNLTNGIRSLLPSVGSMAKSGRCVLSLVPGNVKSVFERASAFVPYSFTANMPLLARSVIKVLPTAGILIAVAAITYATCRNEEVKFADKKPSDVLAEETASKFTRQIDDCLKSRMDEYDQLMAKKTGYENLQKKLFSKKEIALLAAGTIATAAVSAISGMAITAIVTGVATSLAIGVGTKLVKKAIFAYRISKLEQPVREIRDQYSHLVAFNQQKTRAEKAERELEKMKNQVTALQNDNLRLQQEMDDYVIFLNNEKARRQEELQNQYNRNGSSVDEEEVTESEDPIIENPQEQQEQQEQQEGLIRQIVNYLTSSEDSDDDVLLI